MSRLNKKLATLKQQHQQLKLKLQSAKNEAAKLLANASDDATQNISSLPVTSTRTGRTQLIDARHLSNAQSINSLLM
jgi:F0F1-type ATP synthase membrane subunit b/b'